MDIVVFDPSLRDNAGGSSLNLGDVIIRQSIDAALEEIFPGAIVEHISSHAYPDKNILKQAEQADLVIVGGTNLLSSHVLEYDQWKLSSNIERYIIPPRLNVLLLGVGWWQYQDKPDLITQSYYARLLHPFLPHAVRDSYTQNKLAECGIHNTLNTSCPTLWKLHGLKTEHKGNNRQCLFCLTDYHQAPEEDDRFVAFLLKHYDHIVFFPQGSGDAAYAASLPVFAEAGQRLTCLPHDIDALYKTVLRGGLDYIGTRLHTGAYCLNQGLPSLILSVDNRSTEIAKDINLPVTHRGNEKSIKQWLTGSSPNNVITLPLKAIEKWKKEVRKYERNKLTPVKKTAAFHQSTKRIPVPVKRWPDSRVLINLGCGGRWHPDWINIDSNGDNKNVFRHNPQQGIPLPAARADAIYASHCLEHFTTCDAEIFLRSCGQALKTSGVLRIVVPDLEQAARIYLEHLDAARSQPEDEEAANKHRWMIVELIDQLCRHQSGGEMLRLWVRPEVPVEDFIVHRVGTEYLNARKVCKGMGLSPPLPEPQTIGEFRLGGEPHLWMYDEISLARLLRQCGFSNIRRMDAATSAIEDFSHFHLDTNVDDSVYKPDSLYMEGLWLW
jgi:Uncharacterized protein conserved in bacteria